MLPYLLETPPNDTLKWAMVAVAGATILFTIFRPSMRKKDPLSKAPAASGLAHQRNVERQMQTLVVELSEMARQLTAQLDTRSQKLEMLLQEADEKIAALRQANNAANPGGSEFSSSAPARMTSADREAWTIRPQPAAAPGIDPQHQQVYSLADQGTAASDIARQLNRPRGEVELILALRPRV